MSGSPLYCPTELELHCNSPGCVGAGVVGYPDGLWVGSDVGESELSQCHQSPQKKRKNGSDDIFMDNKESTLYSVQCTNHYNSANWHPHHLQHRT